MHFKTPSTHSGYAPKLHLGSVMIPIYQNSTFVFEDVNRPGPYDYAEWQPDAKGVEGLPRGSAFATGMAAKMSALMLFQSLGGAGAC